MNPTGAKVAANQQNVRASERFDLEVTVDLESDHNFYTGLTQNISSGGVFIATHHMRRIGDRITLKFTLARVGRRPSTSRPRCAGSARTRRSSASKARQGMGVRFINLSPEASAAINAFIQSRDSLYYDDED